MKQCEHCSTQETPCWRRGPGNELLCNACGIRLKTKLMKKGLSFHQPTKTKTKYRKKHQLNARKINNKAYEDLDKRMSNCKEWTSSSELQQFVGNLVKKAISQDPESTDDELADFYSDSTDYEDIYLQKVESLGFSVNKIYWAKQGLHSSCYPCRFAIDPDFRKLDYYSDSNDDIIVYFFGEPGIHCRVSFLSIEIWENQIEDKLLNTNPKFTNALKQANEYKDQFLFIKKELQPGILDRDSDDLPSSVLNWPTDLGYSNLMDDILI